MPSPAGPFHTAQESALKASSGLIAAAAGPLRVLTEPPTNAMPPYVVIGNTQVLIEAGDCGDEAEIFATVDVWSRTEPLDKGAQARAMGGEIIDALNLALSIDGWTTVLWEMTSERYVTDPDQSTHGTIEFRYLLTQSEIESEA
jgi:hypothetical protein